MFSGQRPSKNNVCPTPGYRLPTKTLHRSRLHRPPRYNRLPKYNTSRFRIIIIISFDRLKNMKRNIFFYIVIKGFSQFSYSYFSNRQFCAGLADFYWNIHSFVYFFFIMIIITHNNILFQLNLLITKTQLFFFFLLSCVTKHTIMHFQCVLTFILHFIFFSKLNNYYYTVYLRNYTHYRK